MSLPRKLKTVLITFAFVVVVAAFAIWLSWPRIEMWAAGIHQKSVTQSLREWGREYASVTNDKSAVAAADMGGYMSRYYVPGPGYRGPAEVEAALETQRAASIRRVTEALAHYTGLDYGTNAQRWREWAEARKTQLSAQSGEPVGPANQSQPIQLGTNSTRLPAGSGR